MSEGFDEFENRLRNRLGPEPTVGLRARVLTAVDAELANTSANSNVSPAGNLHWPAIAAAAVVLMGLSLAYSSQDAFPISAAPSPSQINAEIQTLHQLDVQLEGNYR